MYQPRMNGPRPVMRSVRPKQGAGAPEQNQSSNDAADENIVENVTSDSGETEVNTPVVEKPIATAPKKPVAKANTPKPPKEKKEGSNTNAVKIILIGIIVILLGAVGYLSYDKLKAQNETKEAQATVSTIKNDVNSKIAEINHLQDSLRTVISEKAQLGQELSEDKAKLEELEVLKQELQQSKSSIKKLNKKLDKAQRDYQMATASIESMNASRSSIMQEREEMQQLLKAKEDSLRNAVSQIDEIHAKVKAASNAPLRAGGTYITVFTSSGKELKAADSYKAVTVGRIKMSLTLMKNEGAEGSKEIFMRLIEPSGTVLFQGDKSFTLEGGKKTTYTDKRSIDLGAGQHSVTFLHAKGSKYKAGKYTIEYYCDGKKISESTLDLKN